MEPVKYQYYRPQTHVPHAYPLPEVVDPEEERVWRVRRPGPPAVPSVNFEKKLVLVPTERDDEHEDRQRLHELAHVKWSKLPAGMPDGSTAALVHLAVEDARIHGKLKRAGGMLAEPLTVPTPDLARRISMRRLSADEGLLRPLGLLSCRETADWKTVREMAGMTSSDVKTETEAWRILSTHRDPFSDEAVEATIKFLMKELPQVQLAPSAARRMPGGTCAGNLDQGDPDAKHVEAGSIFDKWANQWMTSAETSKEWGRIPPRQLGLQTVWGDMKIEEPPRTIRTFVLKGKFADRVARIPSEEGVVPTRWARWPVDQWVFQRKLKQKRKGGGSLLIDGSGSMHISDDDVKKFLKECPAAVVAVYGGDSSHTGTLRVLAKGGFRVEDRFIERVGGNNIVDGPALVWLGHQPEPRVWISDEGVTGRLDIAAGNVLVESQEIRVHHRISRVPDATVAATVIKERREWSTLELVSG